MKENTKTLENIQSSKKWVVVLSDQGTADIHEGLLGKIIITLPFEKKEIADLICRFVNAHDILVQQRDDLMAACEMAENWLLAISKRKGGLVLMVQACPYSVDNHTRRKIQAAIKKAQPDIPAETS